MIKALRKSHYVTWKVLSLLIPVLFILSILWRPHSKGALIHPEDFIISVLEEKDSTLMVRVELLNDLTAPSCLVMAKSSQAEVILGSLNDKGEYFYQVPKRFTTIRLFDGIHNRVLYERVISLK